MLWSARAAGAGKTFQSLHDQDRRSADSEVFNKRGCSSDMPSTPARQCRKPGCRGIVKGNVCSVCGPLASRTDNRPNSRQRGYDRRWNKIAEIHKHKQPLCQVCEAEGRTTIATISHHVEAVSKGGEVHVGDEELVAVCAQCHQRIEGLGAEWRRAINQTP